MAARPPLAPEIAQSLALAMVAASEAPVLLLDGDLTVIAASASFCRSFEIEPAETSGLPVFELGSGEWNVRQLRALLKAVASGMAAVQGAAICCSVLNCQAV